MLTRTVALAAILHFAPCCFAQAPKTDEVSAAIKAHFKTSTPEANRYRGLTTYGETLSKNTVTPEQAAAEVALLKQAAEAGMLKSPAEETLLLVHNVIIHDPSGAEPYWKALRETPWPLLPIAEGHALLNVLAAGPRGEAFALAELASGNPESRKFWARYLATYALYPESAKLLQDRLAAETDPAIKDSPIRALTMVGSPASVPVIKEQLDKATDDKVQSAAIFAYAELVGFESIAILEGIQTLGPLSAQEKQMTLDWLKTETSAKSKHGREISSDSEFIGLYADLRSCPTIAWLEKEGFFSDKALKEPPALAPEKKSQLLDLLIDSKGFGLEAVKGSLVLALTKEDEAKLLRIREVSFYSPSRLSGGRASTVGIMVRHIRQEK